MRTELFCNSLFLKYCVFHKCQSAYQQRGIYRKASFYDETQTNADDEL